LKQQKNLKMYPDKRGWFEKQLDKLDDINPLNYFEKRKKCREWADQADTVHLGKIWYKQCMDQ